MSTSYLDELNESQRQAVLYNDGPSLVIAGAGSGKTRVLTYKIAYLLEQGLPPWSILALTFTNKAAREMQQRIARQVGDERARSLWMGTFHSIFLRILRHEAERIGYAPGFTIYDQDDSRSLIRTIIKEQQLDDKTYRPNSIQARISAAKNRLIGPDAYAANPEVMRIDAQSKVSATALIYRIYMERCRLANAMDFDDLLYYTHQLFTDHPDVCARYEERFQFVLVDEYQDTNYAQHCIVRLLTEHRRRVCVVGDDAQSIYSFRGANIDNILNFQRLYEGARLFKLEQNYRSTQVIVKAANSLIAHNREQIHKDVFSEKSVGERIALVQAYSDREEADIVANKIGELHRRKGLAYDEMAILYRTNGQSRLFEEALRRRGYPYRIYGGLSFYQRKEVKDSIAYFRLAVNPHDEEALRRVVNYPARGIGQTTQDKLAAAAATAGVSLWDVLCRPAEFGVSLNKGTQAKLDAFATLIRGFVADALQVDAATLGTRILRESGIYGEVSADNSPENLSRKENVEEIGNGLSTFVADARETDEGQGIYLADYLQEVSLLSDLDSKDDTDEPRLTLMTIHSAKGLEFRAVFVVGLEENLFPNIMQGEGQRHVDEERRLFYVALTRAEEYCCLTYAKSRFRYGKMDFAEPSRFLKDIDPQYLAPDSPDALPGRSVGLGTGRSPFFSGDFAAERRPQGLFGGHTEQQEPLRPFRPQPVAEPAKRLRPLRSAPAPQTSGASASSSSVLQAGATIEHERFGLGRVLSVEGSGDNAKATVDFRNVGRKQLLLRFARFKVVE